MRIADKTLYESISEANETIDCFRCCHPKSKKKFVIRKKTHYQIIEVQA